MTYSAVFCISTSELHERLYAPYRPSRRILSNSSTLDRIPSPLAPRPQQPRSVGVQSVGGGATSGDQRGPRWGQISVSFPVVPLRTGATRCPSTRPKPSGTTSGCCPSSPPIWVAPPARRAGGSATDTSPDVRRHAPRTGGSCSLRPRRSTSSAIDWQEPGAARPVSTPASPKPSTVTFHRRSLLDRSRCPTAPGSSRPGGRGGLGRR